MIRDILLIGHRQAFAWVDEWCGESAGLPPGVRVGDTVPGVTPNPQGGRGLRV